MSDAEAHAAALMAAKYGVRAFRCGTCQRVAGVLTRSQFIAGPGAALARQDRSPAGLFCAAACVPEGWQTAVSFEGAR